MSGRDDLIRRAQERAQGLVVPETWGDVVTLEPGETFFGRFRGREQDQRGNTVVLVWDEDDNPRFFWSAYRLTVGVDAANPSVGDNLAVARGQNYRTRYDDAADEPSGRSYGVDVERNDAPVPEEPEGGDDIPF